MAPKVTEIRQARQNMPLSHHYVCYIRTHCPKSAVSIRPFINLVNQLLAKNAILKKPPDKQEDNFITGQPKWISNEIPKIHIEKLTLQAYDRFITEIVDLLSYK